MSIKKVSLNGKMFGIILGGVFFLVFAGTVLANPPYPAKPNFPDMASQPNEPEQPEFPSQPDFPPQPEIPPCPECDDFDKGPTPGVPTQTPQPTTSPSIGGNGGGGAGSSSGGGGGGGDGGQGGGGQVFSLSDTASSNSLAEVLGFLGLLLIISGLRLKKFSARSYVS